LPSKYYIELIQGANRPGKPGKFREFVHSGKVRENSGNSWMTQGIFNTWKI